MKSNSMKALVISALTISSGINGAPFILHKVVNNTSKSVSIVMNEKEIGSVGPRASETLNTPIALTSETEWEQINFKPTSGSGNRLSNTMFRVGPKDSHQIFSLLVSRSINLVSPNKQFPGTTHRSQVEIFMFENTLNHAHHDDSWEKTSRFSNNRQLYRITITFNESADNNHIRPVLTVNEQIQ